MIPAYSPQARGRAERNFGTWQGRLPQELRLRGIGSVEPANRFLREEYIDEFNRRFRVVALQAGSAFVPCRGWDLDRVFSIQQTRTVAQDNTITLGDRWLQIEATNWRGTLAGCRVTVHEHLDGTLTATYGPHVLGRYNAQGLPLLPEASPRRRRQTAVEKPRRGKLPQPKFPSALGNPAHGAGFPLSHSRGDGSSPTRTGQITCYKKRTF
jgi:hypothetical protein